MLSRDQQIIRELAKRYMALANSDKVLRANERMRATNDLKVVRPPVIMEEIPWYQMDIDNSLVCLCQDPKARELEWKLRVALYRDRYFACDMILDPFVRVNKVYGSTGIGLECQEDILSTEEENHIVSHQFEDVLESEDSVEKLRVPEFFLRPEIYEKDMNIYMDLLGDTMPVRLCGLGCTYTAPWDTIARLRGVTPIFYDFYDRPEHLHNIRQKFHEITLAELDFAEKNIGFEPVASEVHCTPGYISGLADSGSKAVWFRAMAQPLADISPEMFEEFELDYARPLAEKFAYTYYGCCEPLDKKLDVLKKITNLRKVGVSPWANEESSAEQLGGGYVYARKPNPAYVAIATDPEAVRAETEKTVKLCQKYGCPLEFVLKDISTVSHKPENLILWSQTVSDVLDAYYGK